MSKTTTREFLVKIDTSLDEKSAKKALDTLIKAGSMVAQWHLYEKNLTECFPDGVLDVLDVEAQPVVARDFSHSDNPIVSYALIREAFTEFCEDHAKAFGCLPLEFEFSMNNREMVFDYLTVSGAIKALGLELPEPEAESEGPQP